MLETNRPCTNDVPESPFLRALTLLALKGINKLRGISRASESRGTALTSKNGKPEFGPRFNPGVAISQVLAPEG